VPSFWQPAIAINIANTTTGTSADLPLLIINPFP
jgi:hypothetical protein